ncbi:MAG: rhodanese-like domain-containing protein [Hyphomicrobiaceae bacterium]|nr:rhodanese-like domain-containing protein [Hyphomicrobiaceae bacterium]
MAVLSGASQASEQNRSVPEVKPHPLAEVEQSVRKDYTRVLHSDPAEIERLLADPNVVLLDVREPGEFAISHLPGATRVDPNIWTSSFVNAFGQKAAGKTFVLYCAVGVRSSRLAQRVQDSLKAAGARDVVNMSGGIFRWHNEQRTLIQNGQRTDIVHKYDDYWGRLIDRQDKAVNVAR